MFIETGAIAVLLAGGRSADALLSRRAKTAFGDWIQQAPSFDWVKFVAQRSWYIYTRIFGTHSTSLRFVFSSFLLYVVLIILSALFLYLFFPHVFTIIVSVWRFGTLTEQFWWTLMVTGGGAIYVIANAQTLYFLEILKTAPTFFRFLLVAYADVLITASVALFGVPLLLTGYTAGIAYFEEPSIGLRIDFSQLTVDPMQETLRRLSGKPRPSTIMEKPNEAELAKLNFTVHFSLLNPQNDDFARHVDYGVVRRAISRGDLKGRPTPKGRYFTIYDDAGKNQGTVSFEAPHESVTTYSFERSSKSSDQVGTFCRKFSLNAAPQRNSRVIVDLTEDVERAILTACLQGRSADVVVPVRLNPDNLNLGAMYRQYTFWTLNDLMSAVATKFKTYLAVSPFRILDVSEAHSWTHEPGTPTFDSGGTVEREEMWYKAYLRTAGTDQVLSMRSLPAGSINFAIMSTAVFNIIVMSVFFVLFPLVKMASRQEIFLKYLAFDRLPFTIFSAILSVWLLVVTFIGYLFS